MSATKNTKRVKYNFTLNFPEKPFTIKTLMGTGVHAKYITIYKRIVSGLSKGTIVVDGEKSPKNVRRGRKELVYRRSDAKVNSLTATATV